jgi:hypothetical protein
MGQPAARAASRAWVCSAFASSWASLPICAQPILYPELANASSLKAEVVAGLDILIVRELTGDIYFGQPRGIERRVVRWSAGAFRVQHHALQRKRDSPHRAGSFRGGTQAQPEAVLGRQDERPRDHPALA